MGRCVPVPAAVLAQSYAEHPKYRQEWRP
ncbi:DUF6221 family protein [Streptomyces sp. NPDC047028]